MGRRKVDLGPYFRVVLDGSVFGLLSGQNRDHVPRDTAENGTLGQDSRKVVSDGFGGHSS